ncbi:MAG: (Fe-S)-binding protein [Betaproteobacteria bacterium]|nr:(Fe-S)-binding protein [Betaproteobacteria bacterium]
MQVATLVDMRRSRVMEQPAFPPELVPVFNSLERFENPFQSAPAERADWTKELKQPVTRLSEVAVAGKTVEYLFFVSCVGYYVSRNQKIALALARILQDAGIRFAILGKEESFTGDLARRRGREYLAQQLAVKTIEKLNFNNVRKVITAYPHCFNAIRNEYPQLGGNFEVVHHSQRIDELIAAGRLRLDAASAIALGDVKYHDPCYLGRYNRLFDEPRGVNGALAGADLVEMPCNRKQSFCRGGGGGRAFLKDQGSIRINEARMREALKDRIGGVDTRSKVRALDLAEPVAGSLKTAPGALVVSDARALSQL